MSDQPASAPAAKPMYVGYLPAPPAHRRFFMRTIPLMAVAAAALAALLAFSQRDPGDAVKTSAQRDFVGVLLEYPYPMLVNISSDAPNKPVVSLLVQPGKHGAQSRTAGLDGHMVRIIGTTLNRDGRRLIELAASPDAVTEIPAPSQPKTLRIAALGAQTLRGEIIDSQCYMGAMKPGDGKSHKTCATLCIAGGVPPMLVTHDQSGAAAYYILTTRDGQSAGALVTPYLGVPVEITGDLQSWSDLKLLQTDADSIHRL